MPDPDPDSGFTFIPMMVAIAAGVLYTAVICAFRIRPGEFLADQLVSPDWRSAWAFVVDACGVYAVMNLSRRAGRRFDAWLLVQRCPAPLRRRITRDQED